MPRVQSVRIFCRRQKSINQSSKQTVSSSLVIFRDVPPCRLCDWLLLLGLKGWLAVLLPCSFGARKERKYCYQECDVILIGITHFGGGFDYIFSFLPWEELRYLSTGPRRMERWASRRQRNRCGWVDLHCSNNIGSFRCHSPLLWWISCGAFTHNRFAHPVLSYRWWPCTVLWRICCRWPVQNWESEPLVSTTGTAAW